MAENKHHGPSVREGLAKGHAKPTELKEHLVPFASVSRLEKNWILPKFLFAPTQNPCLEAQTSVVAYLLAKETWPRAKGRDD